MALYGAFDQTLHLDELDTPLVAQDGVLTPAVRRARVLANLGVTSTAAELNVLDGIAVGLTAAELSILDGVTATAAELNAAADVSGRLVDIADADTYAFLVADSGKVHVVSAITGDMAFTLPAAAVGLNFELRMGGIVAEADDWTFTTTADDPFAGGLAWFDEDAGAGDGVDTVLPNGTDDFMTIVNPDVGTKIEFIANATVWYVCARIMSDTIPTFTTP